MALAVLNGDTTTTDLQEGVLLLCEQKTVVLPSTEAVSYPNLLWWSLGTV